MQACLRLNRKHHLGARMEIFTNKGGQLFDHSNLAPIRRYASKYGVDNVSLRKEGSGAILWVNYLDAPPKLKNKTFRSIAEFASYSVLLGWVRRWRTIYGCKLFINGVGCGTVSYNNPELAKDFEHLLTEATQGVCDAN